MEGYQRLPRDDDAPGPSHTNEPKDKDHVRPSPSSLPHMTHRRTRSSQLWPKLLPFELAWGMKIGEPDSQSLPEDVVPLVNFPRTGAHTVLSEDPMLENSHIDVSLLNYRHTCLEPKPITPRPWRSELERTFRTLTASECIAAWIQCFTIGYLGGDLPDAIPFFLEQAYSFGLFERAWDIELEGGIYRQRNEISEEGEIGGECVHLGPDEIPDHVEMMKRSEV
ncbi:hypothetical protein ABW21_db0203502 [Orbilia brochopaga]|nr:hypothetical protein ABW21_db0203502 [Drechslerella brochopaga]